MVGQARALGCPPLPSWLRLLRVGDPLTPTPMTYSRPPDELLLLVRFPDASALDQLREAVASPPRKRRRRTRSGRRPQVAPGTERESSGPKASLAMPSAVDRLRPGEADGDAQAKQKPAPHHGGRSSGGGARGGMRCQPWGGGKHRVKQQGTPRED